MFLSRLISSTESRYWFTKLKIADLVWVFKKIRHLIESFKSFVIVYTDHETTLAVAKQTSFTTFSTDKLNLRLVRTSDYIQRFNLMIKHKFEILHLMFDALFRLLTKTLSKNVSIINEKELDVLFTVSITKMNDEFRQRFILKYQKNSTWRKIIEILNINDVDNTDVLFLRDNKIIYRKEINDNSSFVSRRMCVSKFMIKEMLTTVHNKFNDYSRFDRIYERMNVSWYIKNLIKYLKNYITHCSQWKVNETRRHKSYESLQSILSSFISFYTLTVDFILTMFESHIDMNCVMSVIDKYSKRIIVLVEKNTWTANDWFAALLLKLNLVDWDLFKTIISNRDRKFLSKLWIEFFKRLNVKLLYSTVYHFQTNETLKRINQTFEIALRYHVQTLNNFRNWSSVIDALQRNFNNSITSTDKFFNEICYEFTSLQNSDLVRSVASEIFSFDKFKLIVQNSIAMTQMTTKRIYDRNHQVIQIIVENWTLIRLHKKYNMSTIIILEKKLSQQYVQFFKIIQKIKNLTYKLQIFETWEIWSIFAISQLKSSQLSSSDSFQRTQRLSRFIFVKKNTNQVKSFEIEKLLIKTQIKRREIEYLIRWQEYDFENNAWRSLKKLENATQLIDEYKSRLQSALTIAVDVAVSSDRSILRRRNKSKKNF